MHACAAQHTSKPSITWGGEGWGVEVGWGGVGLEEVALQSDNSQSSMCISNAALVLVSQHDYKSSELYTTASR